MDKTHTISLMLRRDLFQEPDKNGLVLNVPVKFPGPFKGNLKWYRGNKGEMDWGELVLFQDGYEGGCSSVFSSLPGGHSVWYNGVLCRVLVFLLPYSWRCEMAVLRNDHTWDSHVCEFPEELGDVGVSDTEIECWWSSHYGVFPCFSGVAGVKVLNTAPPEEMGTQWPLEKAFGGPPGEEDL